MVFNLFLKLWKYFPKGLLILLAALLIAYFIGISHGRAPYVLAAKNFEIKARIIVKGNKKQQLSILKKRAEADEKLKDNNCIISDYDAHILSDIKP